MVKRTVGVVVAAYNSGSHLLPALESIAAQTHGDLVWRIVDNGSADDTGGEARRTPQPIPCETEPR